MDFLGLKTLTVIDDCLRSLRATGAEAPDFELVRSLYDELASREPSLAYSETFEWCEGGDGKMVTQHVRRPPEVLRDGLANCLEAALLLASAMMALTLEPVIGRLPAHVLVGYVPRGGQPRYFEAIGICQGTRLTFDGACQAATERLNALPDDAHVRPTNQAGFLREIRFK